MSLKHSTLSWCFKLQQSVTRYYRHIWPNSLSFKSVGKVNSYSVNNLIVPRNGTLLQQSRRGLSGSTGVWNAWPAAVIRTDFVTRRCPLSTSPRAAGQQSTVTPDNIIRSPIPDIHIPDDLQVHQMVFDACDKYKDKLAMEEFLTGRRYTYTQLKDASIRVASALCRKGYRKGDVLLLFSPNCVDYVVLMLACAATGVWCSPANPGFTASELARQLHDSDAKGICASPALASVAKEAAESKEFQTKVQDFIAFGEASGFQPFQELLDDDGKAFPEFVADSKKDIFVLPYSSGTTGFPKGVMLSHYTCAANVFQISEVIPLSADDRAVGLLPLYHIFGMVANLFPALLAGCSISYLPKFEPEVFLQCLQDRKINNAQLVPPLVLFLAKHPMVSGYDLSALNRVFCGAAPLGKELISEFLTRFPNVNRFMQGYGLTELSPVGSLDSTQTPGSVGHLLPNTLGKVVDIESRQTLEVGQSGEICLTGPQVMVGYHKNEKATAETISPDGWLYTGDVGYFDKDGLLFVQERLKELIKYKGSQVAPAELEAVLLSHPDIQDVAVIGVPDQAAGELPKAFVVARPGSKLIEDQVTGFMKGKVAPSKWLRGGVQFVQEIPKNPSGKILRRIIREKYL